MHGSVYWITGLSGSGKTTIGRALYAHLHETTSALVLLDGDEMRAAFADDLGYGADDRRRCAMRYARLCRLLAAQGLTVICCTISMFDEVRAWNRKNIPGYVEVYIKVSMQTLCNRDQKGMYSAYQNGSQQELAGLDLEAELPRQPDVTIENENGLPVERAVHLILSKRSLPL